MDFCFWKRGKIYKFCFVYLLWSRFFFSLFALNIYLYVYIFSIVVDSSGSAGHRHARGWWRLFQPGWGVRTSAGHSHRRGAGRLGRWWIGDIIMSSGQWLYWQFINETRRVRKGNEIIIIINNTFFVYFVVLCTTAILGFHSMMNQDQYHASLLNKGKVGLGWDGVTKASQPKPLPFEPPNSTDPEQAILKVYDDDCKTIELCFNNITLTDDQFSRSHSLFSPKFK